METEFFIFKNKTKKYRGSIKNGLHKMVKEFFLNKNGKKIYSGNFFKLKI